MRSWARRPTHEEEGLAEYRTLLDLVAGKSIMLEEYARTADRDRRGASRGDPQDDAQARLHQVTGRALAPVLMLALTVTARIATALTVVDDTGQRVTLSTPPTRIVSLAPGATEMLFAAGAGDHVIATREFSDEPPAARRVPAHRRCRRDRHGAACRAAPGCRGGLARRRQSGADRGDRPHAHSRSIASRSTGSRICRLRCVGWERSPVPRGSRPGPRSNSKSRLRPPEREYGAAHRPRVLLEVWNHPIYTVGGTHLMSDALRICGATNVFGDLHELAPAVDVEAVIARDPDIIVAAAEPGAAAVWLADWQRFTSLRAVRTGRLIAFEDQRLTRLGSERVDATEPLCKRAGRRSLSQRRTAGCPGHSPCNWRSVPEIVELQRHSSFAPRSNWIACCSSSRCLPVMRTLSPCRVACTFIFESLMSRGSSCRVSWSMPCLKTTSCCAVARSSAAP